MSEKNPDEFVPLADTEILPSDDDGEWELYDDWEHMVASLRAERRAWDESR